MLYMYYRYSINHIFVYTLVTMEVNYFWRKEFCFVLLSLSFLYIIVYEVFLIIINMCRINVQHIHLSVSFVLTAFSLLYDIEELVCLFFVIIYEIV